MNILERIKRRFRWEWNKWFDKIYCHCVQPPYVMSYEECVNYILRNRASIARFGDGELAVIRGKALGFQTENKSLAIKLGEVLKSNINNLLICIPDTFSRLDRYNQIEISFWNAHFYFNRKYWYKYLQKGEKYGNTFLSRFYSMEFNRELSTKRINLLKKLWNNRDIIFVEGKDTKMGVENDLFDNARTIRRVLCPSKDAFTKYDKIVSRLCTISHDDNDLFILALGPTATVLAADLHKCGFQALDLGHLDIEYEWYRMGVTMKVPIVGKFSNESVILGLADNAVSGKLMSVEYENQIILDLSE